MSSKTFCKAPSERAGKQMGSFLRPVPLSPGPPPPTPSGAWAASPLSPTSHPAQVAGRGGLWRRDAEEKPVPRQFGERRWRGSRGRRELVSRPSVSFPSFPAPPAPAHRLEGHCDPDSRWEMRTKKRQFHLKSGGRGWGETVVMWGNRSALGTFLPVETLTLNPLS